MFISHLDQFNLCIYSGALPIDRLRKRHREFEHRMKKRWLSMHEEAAQPFALPRDENERRSRYAMTSLSEEAAKCLHRSLSTNEQQNGGLDIAKVAPRSNKTLEVRTCSNMCWRASHFKVCTLF